MARARNIKPGFFKNEILVEHSSFVRLLFVGLWTLADREGRVEDRPKRIKLELFPYDSDDVDAALNALSISGFIERYVFEDVAVIQIVNFLKHQTPHGTEKDSVLPCRDGSLTTHERDARGYVNGQKRGNNVNSSVNNVRPPLDNGKATLENVNPPLDNTLNPDYLNPESRILNPDSLNPSIACMAMKRAGIAGVNPSHPEIQILINAGATTSIFTSAATTAVDKGKGFSYALAIVKQQMADAASLKNTPLAKPKKSHAEQQRDRIAEFTGKSNVEVSDVIAIASH